MLDEQWSKMKQEVDGDKWSDKTAFNDEARDELQLTLNSHHDR